ncbi:MAG: aromatic ring-hydroxylating oxygenase subunit alpha [Fimbriimonadales bacterium]
MDSVRPEIANARTLPTEFYTDSCIYERAKDAAFAKSWQWIADDNVVKIPGQVFPFTLLEGCLDEPLMLTRDKDDVVHCLSNVCTHRGNILCEHAGTERALRCRYHGRRFGLDGKFQHMPEFEEVEGFPSEADNLPRVPFAKWGPFLFASLEPHVELVEWLAPVSDRVLGIELGSLQLDSSRSRDYLVNANWALYVENYLEGFHVPFVHPSLNEVLDYGSYSQALFEGGNVQIAYGDDAIPGLGGEKGVAALYFWLFPNLMLNFYPWGLSINVVKPLGVDRTRISFVCYVSDPTRLGTGAGAELDRVEREDEAIVETVQRGVRSRLYKHGRYSVKRETGLHQFHRILHKSLAH